MATTFASLYSGIGGIDLGFVSAGWQLEAQCEADPYRRSVLQRWFQVPVALDAASFVVPTVDVLYAELPDSRTNLWWPTVFAALPSAKKWLLLEFSPTVRPDAMIRDLVLAGWSFRLVHVTAIVRSAQLESHEWDKRHRAFLFASRDAAAVDRIGLASHWAEMITTLDNEHPRGSIRWHEVSRGLSPDASCGCGRDECSCGFEPRRLAVYDAGSPQVAQWIAALIDGDWRDGIDRGTTRADGKALVAEKENAPVS